MVTKICYRRIKKIFRRIKQKKRWIFPTFSRHGNAQTSLALLIWLNENVLYLLIQLLRPYQLSSSLPMRPFLTASSILSMMAYRGFRCKII